MKHLLVVGLCAVGLLASCGDDDPGEDTLAPLESSYDLGDDVSVVLRGVVDPADGAPAGERWVAYDLEWFNGGDDPVDVSLAYAVELETSDGRQATLVSSEAYPARGRMIQSDGSVRGWSVFRVPAGVEPATLLLYGDVGSDPAVIRL